MSAHRIYADGSWILEAVEQMELNCGYGSKTSRLPKLYNPLWSCPNANLEEKKISTRLATLNAIMSSSHQRMCRWILKGQSGRSSVLGRCRPRKCAYTIKYTLNVFLLLLLLLRGGEKTVFWTSIKQHAGVCNLPNGPRRSDVSNNNGEPA